MSDGIQIQTVVSDNSVYYHQRQHRSLEHDSMCSSSDKSTSLNSNSNADPPGPGQPPSFQSSHHGTQQHFHHQYQQQAAAALHQLRAVQDCENMNIGVPTTTTAQAAASSGKLYAGGLNNNNNSSNNNKNIGKKMSLSQQQKLEKIRNASNNNNSGGCDAVGGGVGTSGTPGGKANGSNGVSNGTSSASKSIISRLRQLTGRLSFNFDSRESKKLQLLAQKAATVEAVEGESQPDKVGCATATTTTTKKTRLLEKSKTVDVGGGGGGGSVAICASGEGSMHYCCGGAAGSGGVILNQPKSISPILMQHRNSDVIASMNTARNRAYSLDVPISRNCCRSLSGSTAGGGGSSCGGSHKSLTFSLNKSLNEEPIDATLSSRPPLLLDDATMTTSAVKSGGSISETI